MKTRYSANDLSIDVAGLSKLYRIEDFKNAISDLGKKFGVDTNNKKVFEEFMENPANLILDENDLDRFMGELLVLMETYDFSAWGALCLKHKKEFIGKRYQYFIQEFIHSTDNLDRQIPEAATDLILDKWIETAFEKNRDVTFTITYEDLTGEIMEIQTRYKEPKLHLDSIEAAPYTRYSGKTSYDKFYIKYLWSIKDAKYVPVPIRLIIAVNDSTGDSVCLGWLERKQTTEELEQLFSQQEPKPMKKATRKRKPKNPPETE